MRLIPLFFFFLLASSMAWGQQPKVFTRADSLRGTLSPARSCFDVTSYNLNLAVDINNKSISGYASAFFTIKTPTDRIQLDLYENFTIDSILSENSRLDYERETNAIFLRFPSVFTVGTTKRVTVYYHGKPQVAAKPPWDGGFVWSKDSLGNSWVGVACEGAGASLWWPCKDHPSDEPDSVTMSFTVPSKLLCVSNGTFLGKKDLNNGKTSYQWKVSYPINLYNVTLNIADYAHIADRYVRQDGSILDLDYYVLSYNEEKAHGHFRQVVPILKCYEKYFGKYPYEKDGYALVETPYWGMEHQGAIAYGNNYQTNMADLDYIILHESGHEWWGNSVSTADHAELWIHESFTTYGESLLLECLYGYDYALKYLLKQKKYIDNKEPVIGPKGVNYHYWKSTDMYYKGAWMLHTIRNVISNDSLWYDIIYSLAAKFKNSVVTTEDIIQYINQQSGRDLTPIFNQYLYQTNIPVLQLQIHKKKKELVYEYRWEAQAPGFSMPVIIVVGDQQKKICPTTGTFKKERIKTRNKKIEVRTDLFYIDVEVLD